MLDSIVVLLGTLNAFGINAEPGWNEICKSNISKVIDRIIRADGKILKGSSFKPPNIEKIIINMLKNNKYINNTITLNNNE